MTLRGQWPAGARERLVALHAEHGVDTRAIVDAMRLDFPTLRRAQFESVLARIRTEGVVAAGVDVAAIAVPDPAEQWARLAKAEARRVQQLADTFDWLRPVAITPPPPPRVRVRPNAVTLVVGDAHFGHHDERTLTVIGHVLEELRPHRFIWNGDLFDLLAVSQHDKDHRATWPLRDEVAGFQSWQRQYQAVSDAWDMPYYETESNHSGNSNEGRWWRYLNERCPELLTHDEAKARLSYEAWFYPAWARIQHVSHVDVQTLRVFHGYRAQQHGGSTARAHGLDWSHDVVTSHTHRAGSGYRRIPATPQRAESVREWHEIGCACRVQASYTARPFDAVNAFALIHEGDGHAQVDVIKVTNGRAIVGALGRSVAA